MSLLLFPPSPQQKNPAGLHTRCGEFKVLPYGCFNANCLYASHFIFQSKVWHKVWKVISKMLEENERFRSRLLTCSQFDGEGRK